MHALGEAAANGLARMIENPESPPARELVPTRLVVRASSGANGAPGARALEDQGGALAGLAAALTEPPAAGQSSQQRVNHAREAEGTDEQAPQNPAAPRDHCWPHSCVVLGLAAQRWPRARLPAVAATRSRSGSACSATSATTTSTRSTRRPTRTSTSRKTSRATPTTTRTSPSTWRPARAPTTSRRSRSASSPSSSRSRSYFVDLNKYGAKRAEEAVAALEVAAVDRAERRPDRPRHRRRQPGDLLPHATCSQKAGLPTEPRGGLEALADLAGRTSPPASASRQHAPKGIVLLRLGQQRLQRDDRPAQPGLLRRRTAR